VTDQKSIENAVSSITQEVGRLDVLINNAGIASFAKPFVAELREIFETNVFGAANITENFLPLLSESNDARLIYVSSGLGNISRRADPADLFYKVDATSYRMAKAALNMLTACHHYEHAPRIKVWAFCPGYVVTDLSGTGEQGREERRERGAGDPKVSGENLAKIVHGERDADVGKFVHGDGVYPW